MYKDGVAVGEGLPALRSKVNWQKQVAAILLQDVKRDGQALNLFGILWSPRYIIEIFSACKYIEIIQLDIYNSIKPCCKERYFDKFAHQL